MSTTTPRITLPFIQASQAQKEVTHNSALNIIDALYRPVVTNMDQEVPPGSPTAGDCYIIGADPSGVFVGHSDDLACYTDNGWIFFTPFRWMDIINEDDGLRYIHNGTDWVPYGLLQFDSGEYLRVSHKQEEKTLSGATTNSTITIPDRALVIAVNTRVTQAITGATSYSVGVSGDATRYGDSLGITLDTTNIGMSYNPISYYADTNILFTANGSDFTGGKVWVSLQYLEPHGPWSW